MKTPWPEVPLSEVLEARAERPDEEAVLLGRIPIVSKIRFEDGQIEFRSEPGTKTGMILVRPGDLLVSGINAYKGAVAIYAPGLDSSAAATIHYGAYHPREGLADPRFLWYMLRSEFFRARLERAVPGGIKTELKPSRLLPVSVPLPPLPEQRRIVARIEAVGRRLGEAQKTRGEVREGAQAILKAAFDRVVEKAEWFPMVEVAPLVRRPVEVDLEGEYPELGIRSFGRGTFHKAPLDGVSVGAKRLFRIESGDLLFNIVFAWEGAVSVAKPEDHGRVGSHRFLTCVPSPDRASAKFLCFHFLTERGLKDLGEASPGGAGRNRTLGLEALARVRVPVPTRNRQLWFEGLQSSVESIFAMQTDSEESSDALLPVILDRAFRGEL